MLPQVPSLRQLKDYLTEKNLVAKCQTPNNEIFAKFSDGLGIDEQNSYGRLQVDARFWFDFSETDNEFVLNVSYFTFDGVGITREQFSQHVPENNIAYAYQGDFVLRWKPSLNNVYELAPATDSGIYRYFNANIPTITKIA